jgi:TP901 family phage tail tape measure protein
MASVIGALRVDLGLNSAAFMKGLDEAARRLAKTQAAFAATGARMQSVGRALSLGLTLPLTAFAGTALKAGGDFEAAMNRVGAITGAVGGDLTALRDAAKAMGATTQFSASEAADALGFLGMAGFSAGQAIEALPGTLQLAAAAGMDLAQSADIVSNVLSGYGMGVADLARVNDVLVKTFTSSNTDLVQLGEAMKYAGPIASAAGVSFEQSAAAIGLMGNAGIQASMAGTSLRGAIGRILSPTGAASAAMQSLGLSFTDAAGKILPLDQILTQLEPHADDAGLFMELFGQRAGPAMAALVSQGSAALVDLQTKLENAGGTAARIAAAQMEGFNGAVKQLQSAFEGLQIAIAESGLLSLGERIAESLAGFLGRLSELDPAVLRVGTVVAGLAAALGPLAIAAGIAVASIGA